MPLHKRRIFYHGLVFFVFCSVCLSQTPILKVPSEIPDAVKAAARSTANEIVVGKGFNVADPLEKFSGSWRKTVLAALASAVDATEASKSLSFDNYLIAGETQRTDKQIAASSSTTGSISPTSKPGLPSLLGIALSNGAILQNVSGTTLNLTSSAYALVAAFKGDTAETYQAYSNFTRLAFSAAYDLENKDDPLASVRRKQLSEWAIKLRLLGDHSPRSPAAQKLFNTMVQPKLQAVTDLWAKELNSLFGSKKSSFFRDLSSDTRDSINAYLSSADYDSGDAEEKITNIILDGIRAKVYDHLELFPVTPTQQAQLSEFMVKTKDARDAYNEAAKAFDKALSELSESSTLTLGYFNERGSGTPTYSVAKLMYEKKPKGFLQVDLNVSASFYGNPDKTKNEQTFRDFNCALSLEQSLGKSPFLRDDNNHAQISMSFSGSYERLEENRHVPSKKADIGVANVKFEVPIGAGLSIPLSVTYANSSELIHEHEVRGNFGLTLDLDKLKAISSEK